MSDSTMGTSFGTRLHASLSPRLLLSELLLKQWFEPVIPFTLMIALLLWFSATIPNYAGMENFLSLMRLYAEFGFVALGMAFCLITGGIDLSVGAIFALCNFTALFLLNVAECRFRLVILGTTAVGAAIGGINGLLIGYLKARPFLTTLVTLIILRASVNILNEKFATVFATNSVDSDTWDFLGEGYRARRSHQCRDAYCRADHRAHLSQPLALRLAPDRHRRQPQGGAPCRHSGRAHAALHLCAVGHALRDRRRLLCRAPEQHGFDDRRRLGIPGADRRHPGRGLACRRQGHRLARDARRHHHLRPHQRPGPHGHPGLHHLGDHRHHPARRRRHRRQVGEEPRQGNPEDLRQPGGCAARRLAVAGARQQHALCPERPPDQRRSHRPQPGGGSRGRHSRSARPALRQHPRRQHHPFLRPELRAARSLRPYRRTAATACSSTRTRT